MNIYLTLIKDAFISIIYFPVWWYSRGFLKFVKAMFLSLSSFDNQIGFTLWLKNIFVPLFGQNDFGGRIVSFFVRLGNIIVRGFVVLLYLILIVALIVVWDIFPVYVLYKIFL